jgi:hypothetical protein
VKVNISGRGIIPGLNTIAPAYNKDLGKNQILRILGSNNLRVFKADDACLITKKNIDEIFRTNATIKTPAPVKDTVVAPTPDPVVVGVDLAQNDDVVVVSTTEATQEILDSVETSTLPLTTEDVVTTELTSEGVDVDEVVEAAEDETVELTEETTSHQHNNKKKNKKKNRNNYTAE